MTARQDFDVKFFANGRIAVDGRMITLAIKQANGGHYTYIADDKQAFDCPAFVDLADQKLTGPGVKAGMYEARLARQIVVAMCSDLYMIKSDQGDGGWSVHSRLQEDADGIAPTLVSGVAEVDAETGDYKWPTLEEIRKQLSK